MRDLGQSFTQEIKEEIVSSPLEGEIVRALLSSFVQMNGRLTIRNKQTILTLETEHAKVAKMLYVTLQKRYQVPLRFAYRKKMKFDKKVCYVLEIEEGDRILTDLEVPIYETNQIRTFVRKDENIRAFLTGAFLAGGSCNDPIRANYHLEIAVNNDALADYLLVLLGRNRNTDFGAKKIYRRHHSVIYLKKSDQIVNFIAYIGAPDACLRFEEIRVERDFRNNDNRLQICANANLERTMSSAKRQLEEIAFIEQRLGIMNLTNVKLKTLCLLRRENEDASMQELAELLSEELETTISKSNINHLFRSLHQLVERYGGNFNDND